jgi:hypothetical protein
MEMLQGVLETLTQELVVTVIQAALVARVVLAES